VVLADGERWRAAAGTVFQPFQAPRSQPEAANRSIVVMVFVGIQAPLNPQNWHRRIAPALASCRRRSPPATSTPTFRTNGWAIRLIRLRL